MIRDFDPSVGADLHIAKKEDIPKEAFADAMRAFRRSKGISQSKLAEKVDMDHSYVSRLESGDRVPSRDAVEKIAEAFGLDDIETDRLLASAGFAGIGNTISHEHTEMLEVNRYLNSPDTPEDVKDDINIMLSAIGSMAAKYTLKDGAHE